MILRQLFIGVTAALAFGTAHAQQAFGIATMQPGTLNHTIGAAIAKVLKEKGGINALVRPTAGESMSIAMVGTGEIELGMANAPEVSMALSDRAGQPNLRMVGALHPVRAGLFVRKDTPMKTVADLKGKRMPMGYSAMRVLDTMSRAILATGGLSEKDIRPVLSPNVIRAADDFVAGNADVFVFAFGAPKVREVDSTVGGIRALEIPEHPGMAAARKISRYGYLTDVAPGPVFVGVQQPMKAYSFDNMLYTHGKVADELIYRVIDILEKNKADLIAVAPALREFSAAGLYKNYDFTYHPGALRYFKEKGIEAAKLL